MKKLDETIDELWDYYSQRGNPMTPAIEFAVNEPDGVRRHLSDYGRTVLAVGIALKHRGLMVSADFGRRHCADCGWASCDVVNFYRNECARDD